MFLSGKSWNTKVGEQREGSFLTLFSPYWDGRTGTLSEELRVLVRQIKMSEHKGRLCGAVEVLVPGGAVTLSLVGKFGNDGLAVSLTEQQMRLWNCLHPLPQQFQDWYWQSNEEDGDPAIERQLLQWAKGNTHQLRNIVRQEVAS